MEGRDGSEVKSTSCSSKRPGFESQHSHDGSNPLPSMDTTCVCSTDINAGKIHYTHVPKMKREPGVGVPTFNLSTWKQRQVGL